MLKSSEEKMKMYAKGIVFELNAWYKVKEQGNDDPYESDGATLNRVRGHIVFYKKQCEKLAEELNLPLPKEYFLATPPAMAGNYFADPIYYRIKRIAWEDKDYGRILAAAM